METLTLESTAKMLGVSQHTLKIWVKDKIIEYIETEAGEYIFNKDVVTKMMSQRTFAHSSR